MDFGLHQTGWSGALGAVRTYHSLVALGLGLVPVNDTVAMLRGSVNGIEPERRRAVVDDVVAGTRRNDYREIIFDPVIDAIDPNDALPFFDPEELVTILMHFFADVAAGWQGHQHQLKILARVEDAAEVLILDGHPLDIVDITLHAIVPSSPPTS